MEPAMDNDFLYKKLELDESVETGAVVAADVTIAVDDTINGNGDGDDNDCDIAEFDSDFIIVDVGDAELIIGFSAIDIDATVVAADFVAAVFGRDVDNTVDSGIADDGDDDDVDEPIRDS